MNQRKITRYGYAGICLLIIAGLLFAPVSAAEASAEEIAKELADFFAEPDSSTLSPDDLRTIGILFLMLADLKEAVAGGNYNQISAALNPENYACVGADADTDYLSMFFVLLGLLESDADQSYAGISLYDVMVALGMAEGKTQTSTQTMAKVPDVPATDPYKSDIDPDAMIKAGLPKYDNPEMYSQYLSSPMAHYFNP
ncbi:MAG: hypothetical protein JXA44_01980 [Methanospirillaceae archaeon]|nr:hypothetical protein [Methanospirillaceae archaeon]